MTISQDRIPGRILDALDARKMTVAELAKACECSMLEVERVLDDLWVRCCVNYVDFPTSGRMTTEELVVQLSARGQEIADARRTVHLTIRRAVQREVPRENLQGRIMDALVAGTMTVVDLGKACERDTRWIEESLYDLRARGCIEWTGGSEKVQLTAIGREIADARRASQLEVDAGARKKEIT